MHVLKLLILNIWDRDIIDKVTGNERKRLLVKKSILMYLYKNGTGTGPDIANYIDASNPSSLTYLNELVDSSLIEIKGKGESIGGRRPNVYAINNESAYFLSIDVIQHQVKAAILDSSFSVVGDIHTASIVLDERDDSFATILAVAKKCINKHANKSNIRGGCIAFPGLINTDSGISKQYLNFGNMSIGQKMEEQLKIPFFVEHDTKVRTLAELWLGKGKTYKNALLIQLDWGVGLGLILNGEVYRGKSGFSGEFSHMVVKPEGEYCTCGKRGCLETIASGRAMVKQATELLKENKNSILSKLIKENGGVFKPMLIAEAAKQGDQLSISLLQNMGLELGKGIAFLIQILNPEAIIIGGRLSYAGEYLTTAIKQSLYNNCLPTLREDAKVEISDIGNNGGLLGAALSVVTHILMK